MKRLGIGDERKLPLSISIEDYLIEEIKTLYNRKVDKLKTKEERDKFCIKNSRDEFGRPKLSFSKVIRHLIEKELEKNEGK